MAPSTILKIDLGDRQTEALRFKDNHPDMALSAFVETYPAGFLNDDLDTYKDRRLAELVFEPIVIGDKNAKPRAKKPKVRSALDDLREAEAARQSAVEAHDETPDAHLQEIKDKDVVLTAYHHELKALARFLSNDISVLVSCDKILTEFIYEHVCAEAGKQVVLDSQVEVTSKAAALQQAMQGGENGGDKTDLRAVFNNLKPNQVLVLRSLEMLDTTDLIDVAYHGTGQDKKPLLLGFLDPSLEVKKGFCRKY